ncbi:MAG TPA: helix-turn-helix transcriptional regulator [Anaerolineales bacterium]|nr:helix-turn-helix transcriptional regulator [Anaerolineales bacterium]
MAVMAPGTRLRVPELLEKRGWKAMDLVREAARCHRVLSVRTAYRLANGDTKGVEYETIATLKEVFGVSYEELFADEESG